MKFGMQFRFRVEMDVKVPMKWNTKELKKKQAYLKGLSRQRRMVFSFLFLISFLVLEIFFFLLCKLGTDDVTSSEVSRSKHKTKNIFGNNWTIYLKLGRLVAPKSGNQIMYILILLWQHAWFQIFIMQEWQFLSLSLAKNCLLPKV